MSTRSKTMATVVVLAGCGWVVAQRPRATPPRPDPSIIHDEISDARPSIEDVPLELPRHPARTWTRKSAGGRTFVSVQVNIDAEGNNVVGDAANEPSMAVSPTAPNEIVIGWRQFDTIRDSLREAGVAYSHDAGQTWTFPGVIEDGVFRSDPVLDVDAEGDFYYMSLAPFDNPTCECVQIFRSTDGGVSWLPPTPSFGGDKEWMVIDRTTGPGRGFIYSNWKIHCCNGDFGRSTDSGATFEEMFLPAFVQRGTLAVGPEGTLYVAGSRLSNIQIFMRSDTAQDMNRAPTFEVIDTMTLGGLTLNGGINGTGLMGQVWVAVDHSGGVHHGNVYVLGSVTLPGSQTNDVMFTRSSDGGRTWSTPIMVNDDPGSGAWHWFGAMAVAPTGRIDVTWNDTHSDPGNTLSEVTYAFSEDGGRTWSTNTPISPAFDPGVGYPQQNKMGDYTQMISNASYAMLAYAATFNGEQDVYFVRIPHDCNGNDVLDDVEVASGQAEDCNGNLVPDECERADCTPHVIASLPPSGAIDARDPEDDLGWDRLTLTFDSDASDLTVADFEIAANGGEAPAIENIQYGGKVITLVFDQPISAGACTTVRYVADDTRIALGALPADVNADGVSAPMDILALIDGLNGAVTPPFELWQCDIDHSGVCAPADILATIDLLNGVGFVPWNGAMLPDCP